MSREQQSHVDHLDAELRQRDERIAEHERELAALHESVSEHSSTPTSSLRPSGSSRIFGT